MSSTELTLLSLACTILGVLISRIWSLAVEFTTIRGEVAKAKQDNNNVGDMTRQTQLKLFYVSMMLCPDDQPEKRREILNALVRRLT